MLYVPTNILLEGNVTRKERQNGLSLNFIMCSFQDSTSFKKFVGAWKHGFINIRKSIAVPSMQFLPIQPFKQLHAYEPLVIVHVALFPHGELAHTFRAEIVIVHIMSTRWSVLNVTYSSELSMSGRNS